MPTMNVTKLGDGVGPEDKKVTFNDENGAIVVRDFATKEQIILCGTLAGAAEQGYKLMEPAAGAAEDKGGDQNPCGTEESGEGKSDAGPSEGSGEGAQQEENTPEAS